MIGSAALVYDLTVESDGNAPPGQPGGILAHRKGSLGVEMVRDDFQDPAFVPHLGRNGRDVRHFLDCVLGTLLRRDPSFKMTLDRCEC